MRAIFTVSLGIAAMPVFSTSAFAAEWAMTPTLRLGYEFNDNYRMTLQPHNTVRGTTVIPRLDLGVQSEIWGITGSAAFTRKRFSGEEGLDRDDAAFSLSPQYRTERSSSALNVSRVDDAVISEEPSSDLGLVTVQTSRRTEKVQPTWSWSMTERAQIQLDFQLSEVSYTDGLSVGLYDYQDRAATARWVYMLSPLSQIFLTANYSRYHAPDTNIQSLEYVPVGPVFVPAIVTISDVESSTPSARAGVSQTFSETMKGTLMLGWRQTKTERSGEICSIFTGCIPASRPIETSGIIYFGELIKKFDKININATANRNIDSTGAGTQVERDIFSIAIDHPVTERLTGTLAAYYNVTRDVVKDIAVIDVGANSKFYYIHPALCWQWSREAHLRLVYSYNHLKRETEDQAVQSNAAYLTLDYTWPKLSVSR